VTCAKPAGRDLFRASLAFQGPARGGLWDAYRKNGSLRLTLDVPAPSDYMSIVSYYAGDC